MTPEKIKEIEDNIRNYYKELKQIEIDKIKLTDYEKSLLQAIENKKTYKGIYLDPDLNMGMQISERVQTSSTCTSPQEAQFVKKTEWQEIIIEGINDDIAELREAIRLKELSTKSIGNGIEEAIRLCKENGEIIELKYKKLKTYEQIGMILNTTRGAIEHNLKKDNGVLDCISRYTRNIKELGIKGAKDVM